MDYSQQIADYTETFLQALGFEESAQVTVSFDQDNDAYHVSLSTEAPAQLIGFHGDTLTAIQVLMAQHLYTQVGQWLNLVVNVNDYRQRREAALQAMAQAAAEKVSISGQAYTLPPLPANERRIVHLHLSEHPQVTTQSVGEGRQRSVMVSPRSQ